MFNKYYGNQSLYNQDVLAAVSREIVIKNSVADYRNITEADVDYRTIEESPANYRDITEADVDYRTIDEAPAEYRTFEEAD